jgi:plasmid stabilization system protein ParE
VPGKPGANKTILAKKDIAEIAAYYGKESLDLELRFLAAAESAIDKLVAMPGKGAKREYFHPKLKGLRMWPIPDFRKILIFYAQTDAGIEVVRVLRASRDIEDLLSKRKKS